MKTNAKGNGKAKKIEGRACEIVCRNSANLIETLRIGNFKKMDELLDECADESESLMILEDDFDQLNDSMSNLSLNGK